MSESKLNTSLISSGVWKQLLRQFYLPQKQLFLPVIVISLITAATEVLFTLVTKFVVDEVMENGKNAELFKWGILYFILTIIFVICIRAFIVLAGKLSTELMYQLRKSTFDHLQKLSFSFYDKHAVGWLVARVTSDCERISKMIAWGTLDLFWGIPLIMGTFIALLILNWKLGLIVMVVIPLLVVLSIYFKNIILESSRKVRRTNSRLTASYNEGIAGVKTSKILVREQENLEEFQGKTNEMYGQALKNVLQASLYYPLVTVIISIGTGLALWRGGVYVVGGVITLGTLVAFIAFTRNIIDPLLEIAQVLTNLQRITANSERVLGLLNVKPEIVDAPHVIDKINSYNETFEENKKDLIITKIQFKDTCFAYNEGELVLKHLNFQVEAGKTVALVGPTGSGKSTIVNLMCRFYEPVSGQILINGVEYRERSLGWLQSNLGIVLQTPFLFSGTIKSNIKYGNLNATDDEIIQAARIVHVHDLIMEMDKGYDTEVGEGGNNLSTGQKQLISFARAIIADPQIFVMDEATSSVDAPTEHLIQIGLRKILENRTCFIIAHRLSTIRSSDHILVIEDGTLQEIGNHEELLALKGKYYDLYSKQFIKEV